MNTKTSNDQENHFKAIEVAGRYLKCVGELLDILQALDERKTNRRYECTSLYQYAVKHLKLSEDSAFNLITVARKALEIPALKQEIKTGALTVSKARKICSVIKPENQLKWLDFAKTMSLRALEREVARVNPKDAVDDKASYIAWDRLKLELGVSGACMQKLRRVQDLESQRLQKAVGFEGTLEAALNAYLEKFDPVKKAQRISNKKMKSRTAANAESDALRPVPGRVKLEQNIQRKPYSAALEHQINLRDEGRCTHEDSQNQRCSSTRWLDIHHIVPVKDGGKNTFRNLTTLCRAHHQMEHLHSLS